MEDQYYIELIDKNLAGKASKEEKMEFDQLLIKDQNFREVVEDMNLIVEGVQYASTKEELKNYIQTIDKNKSFVLWKIAASISILAVCVFSVYWFNRPSDYYQDYYGRYAALNFQAPRGISDLYEMKSDLLEDYKEGAEGEEALNKIKKLLEEYPNDQDLLLLYGLMLMDTGNVEASINYLEKIDESDLSSISSYYLSLAYLKSGENNKAIIKLKAVVEPDSLVDIAAKLLMKLDE